MAENKRRSRSPRRRTRFSDYDPAREEAEIMQSLETVKSAQTTKVDRKLYVGNLPAGITQGQLVDLLNTALINRKLNAYAGNPVMSAWISGDGHYAFVEFRSIEEANQAISLNNYPILGQNLKVSRPKTYMGLQPSSSSDRNTLMGGYTLPSVSAYASLTDINRQGPLKPLRINLSSRVLCIEQMLSPEILENDESYEKCTVDIKDFLSDFGQLREFYAPREGNFKGNVYLEYESCEQAKHIRSMLLSKSWMGKPLKISFIPWLNFKEKRLEDRNDLHLYLYR